MLVSLAHGPGWPEWQVHVIRLRELLQPCHTAGPQGCQYTMRWNERFRPHICDVHSGPKNRAARRAMHARCLHLAVGEDAQM